MHINAASQLRLDALASASRNRWIALSADETRVVAEGDTFEEVIAAAAEAGERDPLILRVPEHCGS